MQLCKYVCVMVMPGFCTVLVIVTRRRGYNGHWECSQPNPGAIRLDSGKRTVVLVVMGLVHGKAIKGGWFRLHHQSFTDF